ncbi:hypothetical protein OsI_26356 [Oryza sativa Indica Group]|uniref:Uncharacterized protein n=1 Tax=Oryza sativa subsp. indica TaxID=39946 RepID=B8B707_ORYSI|nr:hypothetical protein OsI_26356 [Oryza sativa Indica Group]
MYATGAAGDVPDKVYGYALCRGDVADAHACERCVAAALRDAPRVCPLAKDALVFHDLCQLRYSNRNFLLDDDYYVATYSLQRSSRLVSAPAPAAVAAFDAAVAMLANATAEYAAAANTSRRYGTAEEEGVDGDGDSGRPRMYALAQCTPDKAADVCRACLTTLTTVQLPKLYSGGRTGGGVFGVWCNLRYEVFPFFSGRPLLHLPAFVEAPPPATSAAATRRGGKWFSFIQVLVIVLTTEILSESNSIYLQRKRGIRQGVLPEGQEVAVKRLCQCSGQGIEELKSELVLVAKLYHKNLVRLIGVCLEQQEKILVYEYMSNKSLDTILFDIDKNIELDWGKRFKIINGIAQGLQYLHEDSRLKIVHRDLKASNILLDFDYNPKISDFGLAKIFDGDQSKDITHRIAGTYGYMAPEYAMHGHYSVKLDVFSFGVLVLEIVTGRRNSGSYDSGQDLDLLNHVWGHWTRGNVVELIDPSLGNHPPIEQMLKCIHIGLLCVQKRPASRPTISSVNIMLSSNTVRLPSLSRPAFCIQDVSASDSSNPHSTAVSSNDMSITDLVPR